MQTINAATIHAQALSLAAIAPAYDVHAEAAGVLANTARQADYFLQGAEWWARDLALDAAASEFMAAQDLPARFVTIQTSERGRHKVRNIRARLEEFAATVKANQKAFGGGIKPTRKAAPSITWPAGAVKVARELMQDRAYADALALGLEKCGALFYAHTDAALMFLGPVDVPELPGMVCAMRASDGKWVVFERGSGLKCGDAWGSKARAIASAVAAWNGAPEAGRARAMDQAAKQAQDQEEARAAWCKAHGLADVIEAHQAEAQARAEAAAVATVAAVVATGQALANMAQAPAQVAELATVAAAGEIGATVANMGHGAGLEAHQAPGAGDLPAIRPYAAMSGPERAAYDAGQGIAPGRRDEIAAALAGQAAAPATPGPALPDWVQWERAGAWSQAQAQAMSPEEYAAAMEDLTHDNQHSEALVLQALRAGHPGAIYCARQALRVHQAAGHLTPEAQAMHAQARAALIRTTAPAPEGVQDLGQDPAPDAAKPEGVQDLEEAPAADAATGQGVQDLEDFEPIGTATYSPEDNKLRLYPFHRLDTETYARVKAAGFTWAPKQELFVAGMWTPARADLLQELCGPLEDEDRTMGERAEERADRFDDYQGKRATEAGQALASVHAIGARFEGGQPILVGHHSERKARKDKERMDNGMRRAVQLWDTADYWKRRAAACVRHALYKERPDVRARRIKTIEADQRKAARNQAEAALFLKLWTAEGLTHERALAIANRDHVYHSFPAAKYPASTYEGTQSLWSALDAGIVTADQARDIAVKLHQRSLAHAARWIAHYDNRLAYERAMLEDAGGTAADQVKPEKGGACECWASPRGGWSIIQKVNRVTVTVLDNWGNGGRDFTRTIPFDKLAGLMSRAQVEEARAAGRLVGETARGFHLAAAPIAPAPEADQDQAATAEGVQDLEEAPAADPATGQGVQDLEAAPAARPAFKPGDKVTFTNDQGVIFRGKTIASIDESSPAPRYYITPTDTPWLSFPERNLSPEGVQDLGATVEAMRAQLRAGGVQVVAAPQLFPTPARLANRMIELAKIGPKDWVLEPSAGTGHLVRELERTARQVLAIEINGPLCDQLRAHFPDVEVICDDFLKVQPQPVGFDAVVMNPPFAGAADIAHIRHAWSMLKPGGRLVAICAGGPRQAEQLRPLVDQHGGLWEPLRADTFKEAGTSVRTVLLAITKPAAKPQGVQDLEAAPAAQAPRAPASKPARAKRQGVQDLKPKAPTMAEWETEITRLLQDLMDCSYGDAAGVVEANSFKIMQGWARGEEPATVARTIYNLAS